MNKRKKRLLLSRPRRTRRRIAALADQDPEGGFQDCNRYYSAGEVSRAGDDEARRKGEL